MHKGQFTGERFVAILRQAEKGDKLISELCRQHNVSENSFYRWRSRFGGLSTNEASLVRELEKENARLKRLLAERGLEVDIVKELLQKSSRGRRSARRCGSSLSGSDRSTRASASRLLTRS